MLRRVTLTAPSRLHFGMFSFGRMAQREFGGVGAMIDEPRLQLQLSPADTFKVRGPFADRVHEFTGRLVKAWDLDQRPPCCIEVATAPRQHVGLGLGTQLGLAVAAGLSTFLGRPREPSPELARVVGRGQRSAVGTYGFDQGGLIVDAGKTADESIAPLLDRVELPDAWRFVLIRPAEGEGLSGIDEAKQFNELPPVSPEQSQSIYRLAIDHLVPAAHQGAFAQFSETLYEYGCLAGACFTASQGGPFATPRLDRLVQSIRAEGIQGVGQSSWGPTLFAVLPTEASADEFVSHFRSRSDSKDVELSITKPNRCGANIELVKVLEPS